MRVTDVTGKPKLEGRGWIVAPRAPGQYKAAAEAIIASDLTVRIRVRADIDDIDARNRAHFGSQLDTLESTGQLVLARLRKQVVGLGGVPEERVETVTIPKDEVVTVGAKTALRLLSKYGLLVEEVTDDDLPASDEVEETREESAPTKTKRKSARKPRAKKTEE